MRRVYVGKIVKSRIVLIFHGFFTPAPRSAYGVVTLPSHPVSDKPRERFYRRMTMTTMTGTVHQPTISRNLRHRNARQLRSDFLASLFKALCETVRGHFTLAAG